MDDEISPVVEEAIARYCITAAELNDVKERHVDSVRTRKAVSELRNLVSQRISEYEVASGIDGVCVSVFYDGKEFFASMRTRRQSMPPTIENVMTILRATTEADVTRDRCPATMRSPTGKPRLFASQTSQRTYIPRPTFSAASSRSIEFPNSSARMTVHWIVPSEETAAGGADRKRHRQRNPAPAHGDDILNIEVIRLQMKSRPSLPSRP